MNCVMVGKAQSVSVASSVNGNSQAVRVCSADSKL